jgi:hypothetical protein
VDATQNRKLEAENPEVNAFVGGRYSVAVIGNYVAATDHDLNEVDIWTEPTAGWGAEGTSAPITSNAAIPDPDGNSSDQFGATVTTDGTRLAVTSPDASSFAGAMFIYTEPAGTWSQVASETPVRVTAPAPQADAKFGYSAVLTSQLLVAGEPELPVNGVASAGEVFVVSPARPALSSVKQSHKTWTLGKHTHHTNVKHKPSGGTTFSFTLNEAATVTLKFTEKNKHGHYDTKHSITVHAKAGTTREYVDGPLGAGKKLTATTHKPGHCKVAITATNANGISTTKTLSFEVKKAKPKPKHKKH